MQVCSRLLQSQWRPPPGCFARQFFNFCSLGFFRWTQPPASNITPCTSIDWQSFCLCHLPALICVGGNPQMYSHPCIYGVECRRTNAEHKRLLSHPAPRGPSPGVTAASSDTSLQSAASKGCWPCRNCTFLNPIATATVCEICGGPRAMAMAGSTACGTEPTTNVSQPPARPQEPALVVQDTALVVAQPIQTLANFQGKNVVFTGTFARGNRTTVEDEAASQGIHPQQSVTKTTHYVVVGSLPVPGGSSKEQRARELGVPLISEDVWVSAITNSRNDETASSPVAKRPRVLADGCDMDAVPLKNIPAAASALPAPLHRMVDGESVEVASSSSSSKWKIKRTGDHYYCHCPVRRPCYSEIYLSCYYYLFVF